MDFHGHVLRTLWLWQGLVRYEWANEIAEGDSSERTFHSGVFFMQHRWAEFTDGKFWSPDGVQHRMPHDVADVLESSFLALTLGLKRLLERHGEDAWGRHFFNTAHRLFPDRMAAVTGITPESKFGDTVTGEWGAYVL